MDIVLVHPSFDRFLEFYTETGLYAYYLSYIFAVSIKTVNTDSDVPNIDYTHINAHYTSNTPIRLVNPVNIKVSLSGISKQKMRIPILTSSYISVSICTFKHFTKQLIW